MLPAPKTQISGLAMGANYSRGWRSGRGPGAIAAMGRCYGVRASSSSFCWMPLAPAVPSGRA
jgi:hypothetical protein